MRSVQQEQEEQAKRRIYWGKAVGAALGVGLLFQLFSRGHPWISTGVPDAVMGRAMTMEVVWGPEFLVIILLHLGLSVLYGGIIAAVIYRLNPLPAVLTGTLVALGLYGINFVIYRLILQTLPGNEAWALITHVGFGLIFSGAYKALSVPLWRQSRPA
jgi:hypothetical protein